MLRYFVLFAAVLQLSVWAEEPKEYMPPLPDISVNGETLPGEQIRKVYDFWVKVYKAPGKPLSNDFLNKLASLSRDQAVGHVAVRQYIEKNKLALAPDVLKQDFEAFKADLVAQNKNFADILKSRAKTEDEFLQDFALRAAMTHATSAELEKDMDAVKAAYEKEKLKAPARRVSQIRFSFENTKYTAHQERTKDDAKKQADYALDRAKKGEDFATLAKQLSDDSVSAAANGDLGWIAPTYIPKPVADAVYALAKAGDIADVVESEQGFHILKMTELKSDEQEFKAFVKQRVYLKTLAAENKLAKEAKVEPLKPAAPDKKEADVKKPDPAK